MAFNIFGNNKAAPQQPQQQQQQQQPQQPQQQPANLHEASQPQMNQITGAPAEPNQPVPDAPQSGLDQFADLWQTPTQADGQGEQFNPLQLNDDAFTPVLEKLDFTTNISDEIRQGLAEGDSKALMALLNNTARAVYKSAMQHSTALVDRALSERLSKLDNTLSERVSSEMTRRTVAQDAPSHPLVRQEMQRIATQLRAKYPDASDSWIAEQAKQYITEMASALNPHKETPPPEDESVDFADFAGMRFNE